TSVLGDVPATPPPATPPRPPARRNTAPARRRRFVLLAALLALAGVALAVLLLSASAARTSVPRLRVLPRGGVQARARRMHVKPVFSRRYSDTTAGVAIAQDPTAGTRGARASPVGGGPP